MSAKMARMMVGLVVGFMALMSGTAQAASYTNTLSGNWSDATRWPLSGKPASTTDGDNIIVFKPTATDNSTNDNTGAFWLNQLLVVPNYAVNLYALGGNSLLFTNATDGTLPVLTNAGSSTLTLNSAITLATNLTIGAVGPVTINSNITDGALGCGIIKSGAGTLILAGANTYSGATRPPPAPARGR
jgi:autotransporter-associated beta strand protein